MITIDAYDHVFPLIGCKRKPQPGDPQATFVENDIYGTTFSIGGGYLLTAGHSLQGASKHELVGVGVTSGAVWKLIIVDDYEIVDTLEVGLLRAQVREAKALPWSSAELPMLASVQSIGFPHAFDRDRMSIDIRAFRGDVVSSRNYLGVPAKPRVYELPFACPRGLSGAPVFTTEDTPRVVGMVIGNTATDMCVLRDKEVVQGETTTVVERFERLQLGIAVQANSLLTVESRLLGCSLKEHLQTHGLYSEAA